MMYVQVIAGFVLLLGGAEVLVRGSVAVARRLGVPTLVIGMTVIAFGTSAPELVVSLDAAFADAAGLALGNVVGSNVANVLLILGAALLCRPIAARAPLWQDAGILVGGSLLFCGLAWLGTLDRVAGGLLLIAFFAFLANVFRRALADGDETARAWREEAEEVGTVPRGPWMPWLVVLAGLAAVVFGADVLVNGGTAIARHAGVPEEVIGLTLIAVGTSLPEFAASVVAALRGHADVAVGNVVGSNLFNILGVGGAIAVTTPVEVAAQIRTFDLWVMLATTLLILPYLVGGRGLGRAVGLAFVVAYAAYIGLQAHGVSALLPDAG